MMKFPLIILLPCFILGVLIAPLYSISIVQCLAVSIVILLLLIWSYKYAPGRFVSFVFPVFTGVSFLLLGVNAVKIGDSKYDKVNPSSIHFEGSEVEGVVLKTLKSNSKYNRYIILTKSIDNKPVKTKVLTYIIKGKELKSDLEKHDILKGRFKLKPVPPPLNPHQFNYKKYLENHHIYLQTYITKVDPRMFIRTKKQTFSRIAQGIKDHVTTSLERLGMSGDNVAIVRALFFGDKDMLSKEEISHFRDAGIAHILAISGLHVGIIFMLISALLSPFSRSPYTRVITSFISIALLWSYAALVGFTPSITRAVIMFSFYAFSKQINRPTNAFNTLMSAMFLTLLIDPRSLYEIGFQLSYFAVLSIIAFKPVVDKWVRPRNFIIKHFWDIISISIIVQLGIFPIILLYFHQFSALFIMANLGALFFLELYMILGILVIVLSLLNFSFNGIVYVFDFLTQLLRLLADWVAHREGFIFRNLYFDIGFVILFYAIVYTLYLLLKRINFLRLVFFIGCVLLFQVNIIYVLYKKNKVYKITFFHTIRESAIGCQQGRTLRVFTSDSTSLFVRNTVNNYATGEFIQNSVFTELRHTISFNHLLVLCLDASYSGDLDFKNHRIDVLLIRGAPKLNPERVLKKINPRVVVLDGSNPHYYTEVWQRLSKKYKTKIYCTSERGALSISLNPQRENFGLNSFL